MNGPDLLHEAGALVATGWCQGADATTEDGDVVDARSSAATHWSLLGALQAAAFCQEEETRIEDIGVAVAAIAELIADPSLSHWNDVPGRTKGDVTGLLDCAEELAARELATAR